MPVEKARRFRRQCVDDVGGGGGGRCCCKIDNTTRIAINCSIASLGILDIVLP